jgi:hypothetical protein
MQIWDGGCCPLGTTAVLISEPKTRARRRDLSELSPAHPVSSSRDQQPPAGSSPVQCLYSCTVYGKCDSIVIHLFSDFCGWIYYHCIRIGCHVDLAATAVREYWLKIICTVQPCTRHRAYSYPRPTAVRTVSPTHSKPHTAHSRSNVIFER